LGGALPGRDIGLYFCIWRPQDPPMDAFELILVSLAGWMNRPQQHVIAYLREEIRILKDSPCPLLEPSLALRRRPGARDTATPAERKGLSGRDFRPSCCR
jgi:hypothetical protein